MKTDEIQGDIERTRDEMASTLDAIERKLNPRQLMDQAVDTMKELASDQSNVGHVVRENPIPLALIGLGLGWLAISGMSRKRDEGQEYEGYEAYEGYEGAGLEGTPGSAWGSPGGLETTRSADYGYGYAATEGTSGYGAESGYVPQRGGNGQNIRDKAGQIAGQARENVSRATETAKHRVSQWSRSARYQANTAADRTWEAYQDHPITMGAVAVLLGAAIGAILPRSRTEQEMMGQQARGALRQARASAGDLAERAGHVAETAFDKAKEETKEAFRETKEAAKEEADRQGLTGSSSSSTSSTAKTPGSSMTH